VKGRDALLLAVVLAAAAGTARLGFWQLDRAAQKVALQTDTDTRQALPPLPGDALARDTSAASDQVHRRIRLVGRWLQQHTVYLDNRQMHGRPGFYVLTPLLLDDGTAVLVQRGWLGRDFIARDRIAAPPTPAGPVEVQGRLTRSPSRLYEFAPSVSGAIRQNVDLAPFAAEIGVVLRPLALLQESGAADDGLQRDWPRPAADVQKHYGYAFQWFALSALICGLHVWFRILRPRRRA
jgi:surfeit locus 1 family protein